MKEIKKRASELEQSAMDWLLQGLQELDELDEDDMDDFLGGLPGYLHSPLTDKKFVVEGLMEFRVPERIREHITTCLRSVELPQEESLSRASACVNSLQAIVEYLEQHCYDSSMALRALCIRGLVIREYLILLADLDAKELQAMNLPLYRVIRAWKTTQISQWSRLTDILTDTPYPLPNNDQEMWADVLNDGPLFNLAVLANAVLSRAIPKQERAPASQALPHCCPASLPTWPLHTRAKPFPTTYMGLGVACITQCPMAAREV
jgi:hypothetical protein